MTATTVPVLLLAFANDRDDRTRYLRNLAEEARQVPKALGAAEQRGHCELAVRQNATAGDILDVFQDDRYRNRVAIFHFGGHADGYRLLLETAEGTPAAADAGGLARFLAQQRGLQLVFLNGCSTEGQVSDLLAAGVHAVIATDQAVEDATATAFAARFYRGLTGGAAIAAAYEEAKAERELQGDAIYRHIGAAEEMQGASGSPWRLHLRPGAESVARWSLPQAARDPLFGLPELPPAALPNRPYLYLEQYTAKHAAIFFGRGQEIRTLYDSVTAPAAERVILYYGQSGVGKSSLLEAGLLPRLAGEHLIQYQRRDHEKQLSGTLAAMVAAAAAEADIAVGPDESVAQMWRAIEQHTGKPVVLILDQVEECFTRVSQGALGAAEVEQLLAEIHDLFAVSANWPRGRLILGFRKEWLAEIHNRITAQEISFSEVFLERLNRAGIIEVVRGPTMPRLADKYHLTFKDEETLAEVIAADLLLDPESPIAVTLQVLLSRMWDRAVAKDRNHPIFDQALFEEMQREGKALGDFLDQQLVALRKTHEDAVRSGLVLDILAFHTSDLGTAEEHSMAELKHEYRHQVEILPGLVQEASELSLLVDPRANQPDRPPASRLAHDTLAPLVRQRFSASDAPGQRARRILESRLGATGDGQTPEHGQELTPLGDADLDAVAGGQAGMRTLRAQEVKLVQISETDRRRRREAQELERKRQRQFNSLVVALFFGTLAISLALQVGLNLLSPYLRTPAAPSGTLSFTLSGSPAAAYAMIASWNTLPVRTVAGFTFGLTFLSALTIPIVLVIGCVRVAQVYRRRGRLWAAQLGVWLAWAQLPAVLLELIAIGSGLVMLLGSPESPWPQIVRWAETFSMMLTMPVLIYLLLGLWFWLRGRHSRGRSDSLPVRPHQAGLDHN